LERSNSYLGFRKTTHASKSAESKLDLINNQSPGHNANGAARAILAPGYNASSASSSSFKVLTPRADSLSGMNGRGDRNAKNVGVTNVSASAGKTFCGSLLLSRLTYKQPVLDFFSAFDELNKNSIEQ
jgi:hypothetical protein